MSSSPIKLPITGGCYCGNIRYESSAQPMMMIKCHCRDCQHVTGGPYAPAVVFPTAAFKLTKGELRYHFTNSLAGGKHKRGFCPECGCRITGAQSDDRPSPIVGVLAGSLDDPSWFSPSADLFVSQAEPWDDLPSDTAKFDQYRGNKSEREIRRLHRLRRLQTKVKHSAVSFRGAPGCSEHPSHFSPFTFHVSACRTRTEPVYKPP